MLKSLATVSGWTGLSRILGFVRDVMIAATMGAGPIAEAWLVAFRLPNMFRRIFAEGAYAAAFVPLFTQELKDGDRDGNQDAARAFANQTLSWLLLVLAVLGVAALVFMPQLVDALAGGFRQDPEKFALAVTLGRITFAYLLFMAVTAHISGALNALGHFSAAAAAPILLNVFFILGLLLVQPFIDMPGHILAVASIIAGFAQVALVWWALRKVGMSLSLVRPKVTSQSKRLVQLMIPGTISAGAQQINLLVATRLVSGITGAVAYLSYADRIYQLPLGLIGIAFAIVLLPQLSRFIRDGDEAGAINQLNRGLEMALLLCLPAAVALLVVPQSIIIVLFEHGKFQRPDSIATAGVLIAYAFGLPAFVLSKLYLPGFFARQDTRTPMIYALIQVAINVVLSLLLIGPFGFIGVAAATSIAAWINLAMLAVGLQRRGYWSPDKRLIDRSMRIFAASVIMGILLWILDQFLSPLHDQHIVLSVIALLVLVMIGSAAFFGAAFGLRAVRLGELRSMFRR